MSEKEYINITPNEFNEIMDILQYWTTAFRNGCTENDRLWLQRIINLVGEIRSRPAPSPQKTWESCHEKFTCPNGEDCWYLSEDYHNDQQTVHDAEIRNAILDEIQKDESRTSYIWRKAESLRKGDQP